MTRRTLVVLFVISVAPWVLGDVPIAPLPEILAPTERFDFFSGSATNGDSTLVVWTNVSAGLGLSFSALARMLDSDEDPGSDRNAITIEEGASSPLVATNGRDYLVAYSKSGARSPLEAFVSVRATIVDAGGRVGPYKTLNESLSAGVAGVAWDGSQWLVLYNSGSSVCVATLDASFDVTSRIPLGTGRATDILKTGDSWWAVIDEIGVVYAVEIRTGLRHQLRVNLQSTARIVPLGGSALLFVQTAEGVGVARLDPTTGLSAVKPLFAGNRLVDAKPWQSGALVLHFDTNTFSVRGSMIDGNGNAVQTATLLERTSSDDARLGDSKDGLTLFARYENFERNPPDYDIYALDIPALAPLDPSSRRLVSQSNIAVQQRPLIESNGQNAVAFWSQTVDATGRQSVFSHLLDATGLPFGEAVRLPITLGAVHDIDLAFDGERFLLAWSADGQVRAASISADASTAGNIATLGAGSDVDLASNAGGTFAVWQGCDGNIAGTPLRDDASPQVPGGFALVPVSVSSHRIPHIASAAEGFVILWSEESGVKTMVISPAGIPQTSSALTTQTATNIVVAAGAGSILAAWMSDGKTMFAASDGAARTFAPFGPWGNTWTPMAIVPVDADRYRVTLSKGGVLYSSIVSMRDAVITGIAPLRLLCSYPVTEDGVTGIGDLPLVLYTKDRSVFVASGPTVTRQRAAHR